MTTPSPAALEQRLLRALADGRAEAALFLGHNAREASRVGRRDAKMLMSILRRALKRAGLRLEEGVAMDSSGFLDELGARMDSRYGAGCWHCDDIWGAEPIGSPVRNFLDHARAPAAEKVGEAPSLFGTYQGKRVLVVMASRFGDVGITERLDATHGYSKRVHLPELDDLSATP